MKILVTGGAGFIGSHIADRLIELGHDVVIVDNLSTGSKDNVNPRAAFYQVDITTKEDLEYVFKVEEPEAVIHQAAQIDVQLSLKFPSADAWTNVIGTINTLECCKNNGVKKIIYASSAAVYGTPLYLGIDEKHPVDPLSPYGISKHTPEHFIRAYHYLYGLKYTILRYANVYGTRQGVNGEGGVISIFINKLLSNERPVIYGDGEQTRDFIYVSDVTEANVAALHNGDNEIFNISTNEKISVNSLLTLMNQVSQTAMLPIYKDERSGDIKDSYLDNRKALEQLNWSARFGLREGLTETIYYYRNAKTYETV